MHRLAIIPPYQVAAIQPLHAEHIFRLCTPLDQLPDEPLAVLVRPADDQLCMGGDEERLLSIRCLLNQTVVCWRLRRSLMRQWFPEGQRGAYLARVPEIMFNDQIFQHVLHCLGKIFVGLSRVGEMSPGSVSDRIAVRQEEGILGPLLMV